MALRLETHQVSFLGDEITLFSGRANGLFVAS